MEIKKETLTEKEERLRKIALEALAACKGKDLKVLELQRILTIMETEIYENSSF